jgi:hypothetical protein
MSREAMKLALEALETERPYLGPMPTKTSKAITALREALAEQPAQKCSYPYCGCNSKAWCKVERNEALDKMAENARELGLDYEPVCNKDPQGCWNVRCQLGKKCKNTPAQRTWVGLTNNELQPIADEYRILFGSWVEDFARAIEAKLKEKNNG